MSQPSSRAASVASDREGGQQPQRPSRNRRGRSRTPRSLSAGSSDEHIQPNPNAANTRGKRRRGAGGNTGGLPVVDEAGGLTGPVDNALQTAGGAIEKVQGTVGQVTGGGGGEKKGGGNQPVSLRLDLNLEVDVALKATLHGDLTLSLL
ncbi:hypothetical protein HWV62_39537 [Athelia sp. TMB]|nr:hypothetical protein HWV62_39537 [Athelia sp. TMB]